MQFEPIFLRVLWQFLSARRSRDLGISRGDFLAAFGGENHPNYFKNRPPRETLREISLNGNSNP